MTAGEFLVARNPEQDSKLPYLLRLPVDGGVILKAREAWPRPSRVYCHRFEEEWPADAEILDRADVVSCRGRGAAIDLVLDRPRLSRSQFVFTEVRGRPAIFWQTQRTARSANPGARVPRWRAMPKGFTIWIDTRALPVPVRRSGRAHRTGRSSCRGLRGQIGRWRGLAAVERKSLENLTSCLSDGTLAFQVQRLVELPRAAIVVEGRYSSLHKLKHVSGAWLADLLTRLQLRYPEVRVVFADTRAFAEDWTCRFLEAATADTTDADG